jgi:hypothetical protein
MPSRYPVEVRRQVVALARSGTKAAQLADTIGMGEKGLEPVTPKGESAMVRWEPRA